MAEGRWLPWKEQKLDIRPTPDYKELAKPLRAPPHGLEWRRVRDGSWELRSTRKALSLTEQEAEDRKQNEEQEEGGNNEEGEEKERAPEFLEHVVLPDDTLVGICLKYKVKDRELRRLNGFVGNHFRMCDSLIVPNRFAAGQQPLQGEVRKQPLTKDEMMQIFRKASQLGPEETRFYLDTSGWDLSKALAEWRAENRWEAEQSDNARNPGLKNRQQTAETGSGSRGEFPAVSGTSRADAQLSFGQLGDGSIELRRRGGVLAEARVPLLAGHHNSTEVRNV